MPNTIIQLFPDGTAYISNQYIPLQYVNGQIFQLPLYRDQVDIATIQGINDITWTMDPISTVYKDSIRYIGQVTDITDERVTIDSQDKRLIIRDYDNVEQSRYLAGISKETPNITYISYLTTGITNQIIHSLDIDTGNLSSDVIIQNRTALPLEDTQFEIISASTPQALYMMTASNQIQQSPQGTVYNIEGTYTIPQGQEMIIPIIDTKVDIDEYYVIDAPNGVSQGIYTIRWSSSVDLPGGTLYVYSEDRLETKTSISAITMSQEQDISLLIVPNVYAKGIVSRSSNTDNTTEIIVLKGIITNTLPIDVQVLLRYNVGEGTLSDHQIERMGPYVVWLFDMGPNSSQQYSYSMKIIH